MSTHAPVLALAGDHRYAPGLVVATASALANLAHARGVTVLVFDEGLTRSDRIILSHVVRHAPCDATLIVRSGFSELGVDVPTRGHITAASYARLLVPAALPNVPRAVYLDADVMVTTDMTRLHEMALGDATIAGALDATVPTAATGLFYSYQSLGLPPRTPYVNAGVLVLNLESWRNDDITLHILAFLDSWREQVVFHDQDAINAVCGSTAVVLKPHWNYQQRIEAIRAGAGRSWWRRLRPSRDARAALANARIIHFSDTKPWQFPGWLFINGVSRRAHARWWRFAIGSPALPVRFRAAMLGRAVGLPPYVVGRKVWRMSTSRWRHTRETAASE